MLISYEICSRYFGYTETYITIYIYIYMYICICIYIYIIDLSLSYMAKGCMACQVTWFGLRFGGSRSEVSASVWAHTGRATKTGLRCAGCGVVPTRYGWMVPENLGKCKSPMVYHYKIPLVYHWIPWSLKISLHSLWNWHVRQALLRNDMKLLNKKGFEQVPNRGWWSNIMS